LKVLVIRFSSIGDIVLCTPIIRSCKTQLGAEVHFLTKAKFKNVIANNSHIDKTYHFDDHVSELKSSLIAEDYDYVVDLHNNLRSRLVKFWLGKPSGTFPKLNIQKFLLVNAKINCLPDQHIVDRYFQAYDKIKNDGKGLDYKVRKENVLDLGLGQFVCLVLGATYYTKRIPEEIVSSIISGLECSVVLVGGPEEKELGERLAGKFTNAINACGLFNLDQSASIVEQSKAVITSDTGMMHIASALKKPVFMMWGNTVPYFGMGPYETEVSHFQVDGLKCRPCSKLGKDACPKGHFDCMIKQDVERLVVEVGGLVL